MRGLTLRGRKPVRRHTSPKEQPDKDRRRIWLILILILIVLAALVGQYLLKPDRRAQIRVIYTGGIQGHLDYKKDSCIGAGNLSELAADDDGTDRTILIDVGDSLGGSEVVMPDQGRDMIGLMNALSYDALVPGALDFGEGTDELHALRAESRFPILAANISRSDSGEIFEDYKILNIGKVRVALVGVTQGLSSSQAQAASLVTADPYESVVSAVSEIGGNADAVIVAAYVRSQDTLEKIAAVPGVSLVIGPAQEEAGDAQTDSGVLITHPGSGLGAVGCAQINIKKDSVQVTDSFIKAEDMQNESQGTSDTEKALESMRESLARFQSASAGTYQLKQSAEEEDYSSSSGEDEQDQEDPLTGETVLGDYIADAMLDSASSLGAQAAVISGSEIRSELAWGQVTNGDAGAVFDDDLSLTVCQMTGGQLRKMLEDFFKEDTVGKGFPQVSGITFTVSISDEIGSHISDIVVGGSALEDAGLYTVCMTGKAAQQYGFQDEASGRIAAGPCMAGVLIRYLGQGAAAQGEKGRINTSQ